MLVSLAGAGSAAGDSHDWLRFGRDDQLTYDAPAFLAPRLGPGSVPRLAPLWTAELDGPIVASPLYVRRLAIKGQQEDVVYAATWGGSVYALRRGTGSVIWQQQLGTVAACGQEGGPKRYYGISSTPVIDRESRTIYVIGATGVLHAFDLASGEERAGWPLPLIGRTQAEHVWSGLTLSNGRLFVPVASYCDQPDEDGHFADGRLIAVDVGQRRVVATFDVSPGPENLGGIWGYGGTSVDPADGSIWTATGNSWVFDPECGCIDEGVGYAESIVRLTPDLVVLDSNRPAGLPSPLVEDTDFGSTPLLFQPQGCPALAGAHAKDGKFYVWLRSSLSSGPIWEARIGPDDLGHPFIGEPAWSAELQTLFISEARIYGPAGVVRFDAAVAFHIGPGCSLPAEPTWVADAGVAPKPPPMLVGNVLFVPGGRVKALYAIDARDGTPLGAWALDGSAFSSPTLADGVVLAGDFAGHLHAFDVDGGCPDSSLHAFGGRPSCDA